MKKLMVTLSLLFTIQSAFAGLSYNPIITPNDTLKTFIEESLQQKCHDLLFGPEYHLRVNQIKDVTIDQGQPKEMLVFIKVFHDYGHVEQEIVLEIDQDNYAPLGLSLYRITAPEHLCHI